MLFRSSATVAVTAGAAVTRDFELVSTQPKAAGKDEVVKIEKFVVTTEREGNAKAIMEQRRNMNISTSVAADSFGDGSEGNVGEFLKFLPGVDVEYVDGVSRGPRIGGLDQSYVGVTMDGASIASADAFVSYGATLNGSTGGQSRSVGFEQMPITAIESVEISRTSSADMDASSPAGTINMKTRRAFDRKGRRLDWQVSMSANSGTMTTQKGYGLDDVPRYVIRPNYQLDYSDVFLNQRLGIRLAGRHPVRLGIGAVGLHHMAGRIRQRIGRRTGGLHAHDLGRQAQQPAVRQAPRGRTVALTRGARGERREF